LAPEAGPRDKKRPARMRGEARVERFPVLSKEDLDARQRALWDELTLGPRGFFTGGAEARRLPDLYNAWLQFPELGHLMLRLADQIREHPALPGKLREMVIITTAVLLNCRVEYEFHSPFARNEGLSDAVIAAIGAGAEPPFADEAERIVHEANLELVRTADIRPDLKAEVVRLVGLPGLMQLVAVVGLYTVVSHTSNVAGVKLADDFSADAGQLNQFFTQGES
jgi:4-carboxymuconolactone decarboxylase